MPMKYEKQDDNEVPEYVPTRRELKQLAVFWAMEYISNRLWWFVYQTTSRSDCHYVYIRVCQYFCRRDDLSNLAEQSGVCQFAIFLTGLNQRFFERALVNKQRETLPLGTLIF